MSERAKLNQRILDLKNDGKIETENWLKVELWFEMDNRKAEKKTRKKRITLGSNAKKDDKCKFRSYKPIYRQNIS